MLSAHGRYSRRRHHGRRAEMSTAVLRDDVISARRRYGVELVGVVQVSRRRDAAERARCRVAGRLTARSVVEARVRGTDGRRGLATGRLRVERTVRRKAETSRLVMQLPMVTVQRGRIKAVR